MNRTETRQAKRLEAVRNVNVKMHRALDARSPEDWPDDVPYPNRAVRRDFAKAARTAPKAKVITERMNRSDASRATSERARRVRQRRRVERAARRETMANA